MEKDEAIKILTNEMEKLYKVTADDCHVWQVSVASYIKSFFGENSNEYAFINRFAFYSLDRNIEQATVSKFPRLTLFLNNCIEAIQNRGLYKEPKHNFLYTVDNRWLFPIMIGICGALFGIGSLYGKYLSDVQNIELRRQINELKRSTSDSTVRPPLIIPNDKSK